MAETNGLKYVTYKQFIAWMLSSMGVGATLFAIVLNMHSGQPHEDAAHLRDIQRIEQAIDRMEDKLDRIIERN